MRSTARYLVRQVPDGGAQPFFVFVSFHLRLCVLLFRRGRHVHRLSCVESLSRRRPVNAQVAGDGHCHGSKAFVLVKPVAKEPKFEQGFLYDVFRFFLI